MMLLPYSSTYMCLDVPSRQIIKFQMWSGLLCFTYSYLSNTGPREREINNEVLPGLHIAIDNKWITTDSSTCIYL